MKRMLTFAGVLVFMTGILGVFNASANHKPPKQPGSVTVTVGTNTVTVRFGQHQGRPAKPFYGTLSLQLRALGLDPTRRVCGTVYYTGGVSGTNRICSDLSRWIWAKRGNFLTASLHITSPLPARCRLPAPQTPPHLTQRVNLTFWLDCRQKPKPKPKTPTPPVASPVDAVVGPWGAWTSSTDWSACVAGSQTRTEQRTRALLAPSQNGGATPALVETRTVSQGCGGAPVDAVVGPWTDWLPSTDWSACVAGSQTRTERRTRAVLTSSQNGGATPALVETRTVSQGCGGAPVNPNP